MLLRRVKESAEHYRGAFSVTKWHDLDTRGYNEQSIEFLTVEHMREFCFVLKEDAAESLR